MERGVDNLTNSSDSPETGSGAVGVEFAGSAVSSPSSYGHLNDTTYVKVAAALTGSNPSLQYAEGQLRGYFQPIDGYYRWYGRVAVNDELTSLAGGKKKAVSIQAGSHSATGELSDPDPWGRYRIMGTSTPPFHVPTTLEELNA